MNKPPNILFLMSDEHRADLAGFAGNDVVRTPNLDRLASQASIFSNAYTPSPICVPARQCIAMGQLPKSCGCEGWVDLPPFSLTLPKRLSQYGYETVCCGKLHHNGPDQMQGWTQRPTGLGDMQVSPAKIEGASGEHLDRYVIPNRESKWPDAKEIKRAKPGLSFYEKRDRQSTLGACDFLEEYFASPNYDKVQSQRPLMLKLSTILPHYPYMCSEEKFRYYLNRVPLPLDKQSFDHPTLSRRRVEVGTQVSPREVQRAIAAYYGMVETIDTFYGQVLDKLEELGEDLDEWIILYTSDHGEMLGSHSCWEKGVFHEESVRVPLFIRYPKRFGHKARRIKQNVNLCDLFATFCELTDTPMPKGRDSRSLVPLMEDRKDGWNNESCSQFNQKEFMIKRDHLKYQYYGDSRSEVLFDLACDPGETRDFSKDSAYGDAMENFRKRLGELGHGPQACTDYVSAGYA